MSGKENLTNAAYGKANWMRYLLGGILLVLVIVIISMFVKTFKNVQGIRDELDETTILNRDKVEEEIDEDEETGNN